MSFDPGLVSLGRAELSTGLPVPMFDVDCAIVPDLEDSSAGLLISEATCLKIVVAEASSSTGSTISAVREHESRTSCPCSSSALMPLAIDDCG